jgi:hypothetical protein
MPSAPRPELSGLVNERLQSGACICLLLSVKGHVEHRDVIFVLPQSLHNGADDGPGHARERHDIYDAVDPFFNVVEALSDAQDGFTLEGIVDVRGCFT